MKKHNYLQCSMLLVALMAPLCWAAQKDAPEAFVTKVLKLERASAEGITEVLNALDLHVSAAQTRGRVVVHGRSKSVAAAVSLVKELDAPTSASYAVPAGQEHAVEAVVTEVLTLQRASARDIVSVLFEMRLGVQVLSTREKIVVRGLPDAVAAAVSLVKELDAPAPASDAVPDGALESALLTLQFQFIRAGRGAASGGSASDLPGAPAEVRTALAERGFRETGVLGTVVVAVEGASTFIGRSAVRRRGSKRPAPPSREAGASFHSESTVRRSKDDAVAEELTFLVYGSAHIEHDGRQAGVRIVAEVSGSYASHPDRADINFEINTSLVAELGRYVVVAATPSSTADGDAIALVVRVTRDDTPATEHGG
ncbi:MAG: hypothetical protein ACE5E6_08050 [Phycisphaerae bacterium]